MADWFTENAPRAAAPPAAAPAPASGDWFAQNAPAAQPGNTPSVSSTIRDDDGNVIPAGDAGGGGAFRSAIPAGTSDDALIRHFGLDPEEIKKSPAYQAAAKKYGSGLSFYLTDPEASAMRKAIMPIADSPVGDLGMGFLDVFRGGHQLAVHAANKLGLVSDADAKYNDLINRVIEEDYTQNIRHGNPKWYFRLMGNMAAPVPGAGAAAESGAAVRMGKQALAGAEAAALQPVTDGGDYWTEKGKQTAAGAVAGPVAGAVATGVIKTGTKLANATANIIPEDAKSLMQAGNRAGVRMTYGDITRNPGARKMEVAMEDVPGLGMSGYRRAQHDEARGAATAISDRLRQNYEQIAPGAITDVEKAAAEGDEYARRLLDQVQNAGNDTDRVMQASIGLQNFRTKSDAEGLYNRVSELVDEHNLGNAHIPTEKVREALDWALGDARSAVIQNTPLINLLDKINKNIGAADGAETGNTYARLRRFRSDLGDLIREYRANNNAIIGEKGVGYLERLRGATEQDLQNFIDKSGVPEIQKAAHEADQYYKRFRVPFKDAQLTIAAADSEPDQIFQRFMKAGKGDRAQKFYNALDERGRSAVRFEMVNRAIYEATDKGKEIFSPTKFFGNLENLSDAYGVFFKGRDKWEMDGIKSIMSHIARAGQFAEDPPTGNRAVRWLAVGLPSLLAGGAGAVGGATAGAGTAAGIVGIAGLSKFLLTTNAGKRFLLASTKLQPGSAAMQKLLDQIAAEAAPQAVSRQAGHNTGQ